MMRSLDYCGVDLMDDLELLEVVPEAEKPKEEPYYPYTFDFEPAIG